MSAYRDRPDVGPCVQCDGDGEVCNECEEPGKRCKCRDGCPTPCPKCRPEESCLPRR